MGRKYGLGKYGKGTYDLGGEVIPPTVGWVPISEPPPEIWAPISANPPEIWVPVVMPTQPG